MSTNQIRREAAKRKLERQQERRAEQARKRKRNAVITSVGVVVAVLAVIGVFVFLLPGGDPAADDAAAGTDPAADTTAAAPGDCTFAESGQPAAREVPVPPSGQVETTGTQAATIETSGGAIPITLDRATGPCAVESFVNLVNAGYYTDTPCHRLTTGAGLQVLQCGDPTGQGTGGPGYTINDEPPTTLADTGDGQTAIYPRGTLAMAKTAAPNSSGSQFFLVYADSTLPPDYTVFGTVGEEGLAVLDQIAAGGTDDANGPGDGSPVTPVQITNVALG